MQEAGTWNPIPCRGGTWRLAICEGEAAPGPHPWLSLLSHTLYHSPDRRYALA